MQNASIGCRSKGIAIIIAAIVVLSDPAERAEAGIIFSGTSGDFFTIVTLDPSTTTADEEGGTLVPRYTVTPGSVLLQLVPKVLPGQFVEANSIIGEDTARIGLTMVGPDIKTAYSGSGPATAKLVYTMTIEGNFSGEGDVARGSVEIEGVIGTHLVSHLFKDSLEVLTDGDFSNAWGGPGMAALVGSTVIGAGVGVMPGFGIEKYVLDASSSGFAKMRTTWTGGTIELRLVDIPEPGALLLLIFSLVTLAMFRNSKTSHYRVGSLVRSERTEDFTSKL